MKIKLQHISDMAKHRPPGYYEDVLSHGVVVGEFIVIGESEYSKLCRKYRPTMPGFTEMVGNFAGSITAWAAAGFPVVSNDVFTDRIDTCHQCEWWAGTRCAKCGCFQIKPWLATEKCPIGKWE